MGMLKLSTASGGSITLDPTNTASNLTITVPASTATMATVDGSGNMSVTGNLSFNSGYGSSAVAYGCRAWVNFNGTGTVAIRASGNVSSITDNGTGQYTVNFTNAMSDANYGTICTGSVVTAGSTDGRFIRGVSGQTTTSVPVTCVNAANSAFLDPEVFNVAIFR